MAEFYGYNHGGFIDVVHKEELALMDDRDGLVLQLCPFHNDDMTAAMKGFFSSLAYRLRTGGRNRFEVRFDDERLVVKRNGQPIGEMRFAEVTEIIATKINKVTYDPVCVLFRSPDGKDLTACEDMDGFFPLLDFLQTHYSLSTSDWFDSLNATPFSAEVVTLWKTNE